MKTITIGRGPENMVTLDAPQTSRHHALLRCYPFGKLEIVDLSQNGTYVNGMRIASNKPYPITRKDIVIFAHAEKLNWKRVPAPYRRIKYLTLLILALIAAIIIGIYYYANRDTSHTGIEDVPQYAAPAIPAPIQKDSIKKKTIDPEKKFVFPSKSEAKKKNVKVKSENDKAGDTQEKNQELNKDKQEQIVL